MKNPYADDSRSRSKGSTTRPSTIENTNGGPAGKMSEFMMKNKAFR